MALTAGALTAAASLALGIPVAAPAVGLAACGTFLVYGVDRLRDVDRDRAAAPERSAFVARRGGEIALGVVAAGLASLAFGLAAGAGAVLLLLPILAAGLVHRRIKGVAFAKSFYLSAAWLGVVVGVPAVIDRRAANVGWCVAVLGCAIFANAVASSVRDGEAAAARLGGRAPLAVARLVAAAGIAVAFFAPPGPRALLAVPAATGLVLLRFRADERYGLVVVDGALLAGAIVAIASLAR